MKKYVRAFSDARRSQIFLQGTSSIDVSLTVRAIAGLLFGLLTFQLLGDEVIAQRWEELPEVLTSLLFAGLQPGKETTHE